MVSHIILLCVHTVISSSLVFMVDLVFDFKPSSFYIPVYVDTFFLSVSSLWDEEHAQYLRLLYSVMAITNRWYELNLSVPTFTHPQL